MAKQKKKKFKKPQLNKKDKACFNALFGALIVIYLLIFEFHNSIYFFVLKLIYGEEITYAQPKIGFFLILTVLLFLIGLISFIGFFDSALRLRVSFKEYFSGKNLKAKRQLKHFLLCGGIWFALITATFWFSAGSCTVANDTAIIECNLLKEDKVVCEYENARQVNVFLEYRSFSMVNGWIVQPSGYDLVVEICHENGSCELYDEYFNRNYTNIQKLLVNFDNAIINIDDSNYDKKHIRNPENRDALNRIFDKDYN